MEMNDVVFIIDFDYLNRGVKKITQGQSTDLVIIGLSRLKDRKNKWTVVREADAPMAVLNQLVRAARLDSLSRSRTFELPKLPSSTCRLSRRAD